MTEQVDGVTEFAKIFKSLEPKDTPSITTGTVIAPPPNAQIRLNDVIVLDNTNLIFAASLLNTHTRMVEFKTTNAGKTDSVNDGGQGARSHSHVVETLDVKTRVKYTDTLKAGDTVILVPVTDGQMYYVLDRAVMF